METANTIAAINETTGLAPAAGGVVMLETALIDPNPANPRRDVGDVGELADSIRAQGIRQNLLVVPAPEGRFTLVIGHRRLAGAKLAGLERVPAVVAELDEREQRELMLVENSQRTDLTVVEEADGYQGLLDLGSSVEEAARKTGRSVSLVRRRLKVAAIDDDMRSHVGAAQLSIEDWETIADYEAWPDLQERLAKAAGGRNWNMAVREAKTERKWREWLASARATLAGLDIEPIEEEPSETGRYSRPEGTARLGAPHIGRHRRGRGRMARGIWQRPGGRDSCPDMGPCGRVLPRGGRTSRGRGQAGARGEVRRRTRGARAGRGPGAWVRGREPRTAPDVRLPPDGAEGTAQGHGPSGGPAGLAVHARRADGGIQPVEQQRR
ncbi:ParB/RepB/Spo0J family partition protein [Bifidobacterium longum]|nr:ParB/RepB/Spo0J family partition protein [Bifidobacterium longum]MDB6813467.1 ParB/RepB/Spo0J family partition protein [Bifidobacterium longum]MDB6817510.1 ParB/RepB/Spo0J family partition protein [Bifidobacterium longum]